MQSIADKTLKARLRQAHLVLFWEQAWPALWPVMAVAGLFLASALFDLWPALGPWIHSAALAGFVLALAAAIVHAARVMRWPSAAAARRRLESDSNIAHRPLTTVEDELANGFGDHSARVLWHLHVARARAALAGLRLKAPRSLLPARDPLAFRAALILILFVAGMAAGTDGTRRLAAAVVPDFSAPPAPQAVLEAWINPPVYTGQPPIFLTRAAAPTRVTVPAGSRFIARLQGGLGVPSVTVNGAETAFDPVDQQNYQVETTIEAGDALTVAQDGTVLAEWPVNVVADSAPIISHLEKPRATSRSALRIAYTARDDYGLKAASVLIRRDGAAEPLIIEIALPGVRLRQASEVFYRDLTAHPWAGLSVELQLRAEDEIGQVGLSESVRITLPERQFSHPVARALIEQRKRLTEDPESREQVADALAAIAALPDSFGDDLGAYLAMQAARNRLLQDKRPEAIDEVQQLLWETARAIEDGALSLAERRLREAERQLAEALAGEASDEEIERLMDELKAAMEEFLQALAQDAQRRAARGEQLQEFDPDASNADSQTLQEMLERMRELSRAGAREEARDLLAQLQNMLENLQAGRMAQQSGQREGEQMLNDLGELMRQQQELLDQTFRRAQRGSEGRAPQSPSMRPGGRQGRGTMPPNGGQGMEMTDPQALGRSQEALRRQLGDLMRRMAEGMGDIPRPLGRAERDMRDAREALSMGQPGQAVGPQSNAMDQLRQGAEAMMQEFVQRFGQNGSEGGAPFGRTGADNEDPLGRPLGRQWDYGESVKLPDQLDLQRAREIREELYRRSGERARPRDELDYIDRLLRRF